MINAYIIRFLNCKRGEESINFSAGSRIASKGPIFAQVWIFGRRRYVLYLKYFHEILLILCDDPKPKISRSLKSLKIT